MTEATIELQRLMQKAVEILTEEGQQELDDQGHNASGELIHSFEARIKVQAATMVGEILVNDYGLDVDAGRARKDIPYPGLGKIWTDFINDLIEWASYVKPNLPRIEREQFVFAVARKMRKEGSPTRGSYRYSKNSRRKGWINEAAERSEEKIARAIEDSRFVEFLVEKAVRQGVNGKI